MNLDLLLVRKTIKLMASTHRFESSVWVRIERGGAFHRHGDQDLS